MNYSIDKNEFWHPLKHSYKMNKSTATTLIKLHEEWMKAIDNKEQNLLMGTEICMAFNVMDKDIFIKKIETYGMDETVTE